MLEGDVMVFGEDNEPGLQFGTTDSIFTSGLTANGTQRCALSNVEPPSDCPSLTTLQPPEPPQLVGFEVSDPDNGDAALSAGDVFLLRFDRDVDRAECVPSCAGGRDFVHRLFSFSAQLATDYSGAWDTSDNRTFVVTVTEVAEGFVAPRPTEVVVALRPTNDLAKSYVDPNSATGELKDLDEYVTPWLALAGHPYSDNWFSTIPDRIAVRTADGLSGYATPTCTTLTFIIEQGLQENWQTVDTCAGIGVTVLTGNFGTLAPPRLLSFVADDPDDLDDIYSAGDTLTLGLDMRTDALTVGSP
jgi:hypothetical protein